MTETTMNLMVVMAALMLLFAPLVYICVLRRSDEPYRRLLGLIRLLKRAPRKPPRR